MDIQTPEILFGYCLQMTFQWEKHTFILLAGLVKAKLTEDHKTKHMLIHWFPNTQYFFFHT